ncbi:MAG: PIN domain-containing protein [Myxococcaceae bacterium]
MPMPIFRVLLDANVLFPLALCDTLLRAADADLYQPYWSERVLKELEDALIREMECSETGAKRRVAAMKDYFPAAMVSGYEHLIPAMLNDPGDRHVAAAAVAAGAQVIVTNNLRHFRKEDLPQSIEAQSPDEFLTSLLSLRPQEMMRVLIEQAGDLKNPPMSIDELITGLERSVPIFASSARQHR